MPGSSTKQPTATAKRAKSRKRAARKQTRKAITKKCDVKAVAEKCDKPVWEARKPGPGSGIRKAQPPGSKPPPKPGGKAVIQNDPQKAVAMRKLQTDGIRYKPGQIRGTEIEERILELHVFRSMSARKTVLEIGDERITAATVQGVAARFRRRMRKLDEEACKVRDRILRGIESAKDKSQSVDAEVVDDVQPLTTEEVFGLAAADPTSLALVEDGQDPATTRARHQKFLLRQADTASKLVNNAGRAALTSTEAAESSEDSLRWMKAYQTSISTFKGLAGLDSDPHKQSSGLHLHAHVHQAANNPFGSS